MTQPWDAAFHPQKKLPNFKCDCGATKVKQGGLRWVCTSPDHLARLAELQSQNREQQMSQQVNSIKKKALSGQK
jgi:hypothetical protein